MHITPIRVCPDCNNVAHWVDSCCAHCGSPRRHNCKNCDTPIDLRLKWCPHCAAPQGGYCQHCGKYISRFVEKKCEECGNTFMYKPEYDRLEASK